MHCGSTRSRRGEALSVYVHAGLTLNLVCIVGDSANLIHAMNASCSCTLEP